MITREEYGWLNIYRSEGFKWIARDKNKGLYVYTTEPEKRGCEWRTTKLNSSGVFNDEGYRLFQDIKWEDEKPTNIDDLINDYESDQVVVGEIEKEKQYILKFSSGQYLYSCDLGMADESLGCKLTQSEIESVDPRLMDFAEEVE